MNETGTATKVVNIHVPKQCGTCKHWEFFASAMTRVGWCTWKPGPMPFWAHLDHGRDHDDATQETDGANCATYQMDLTKDAPS